MVAPLFLLKGSLVKVLMLGWEFPPMISGGLGVACAGLVHGLTGLGIAVRFVVPKGSSTCPASPKLMTDEKRALFDLVPMEPALSPYPSGLPEGVIYGGDLLARVSAYAESVARLAEANDFDVIHAHDWLSVPAGEAARRVTGKPLVVHIHSTERDRSGECKWNEVTRIEQEGSRGADHVITVSERSRDGIVADYGVPIGKISVVYNGVFETPVPEPVESAGLAVLFVGRVTYQKGPDYLLEAAARVLERLDSVTFFIAGTGDMIPPLMERAAHLGISDRVLFLGFLAGSALSRAYASADLFILPSVSEPFGIATLEAMAHGTPVIISNQSGLAGILENAVTVDYWDIDRLAAEIVRLLEDGPLRSGLADRCRREAGRFTWDASARQCLEAYGKVR